VKDTSVTPKEQLDMISAIVQDSRLLLEDNCVPYVVWGGTVFLGTLCSFVFTVINMQRYLAFLWIGLSCIALFAVLVYSRKEEKQRVSYLSGRIHVWLWSSIGLTSCGLVLYAVLFPQSISVSIGMAVVCILVGIGYIVTGVLAEYRLLLFFGIGWIGGGFSCFLLPVYLASALTGSLAFLFEFIPGIVILLRKRKHRSVLFY
jgi:hypothetical protein